MSFARTSQERSQIHQRISPCSQGTMDSQIALLYQPTWIRMENRQVKQPNNKTTNPGKPLHWTCWTCFMTGPSWIDIYCIQTSKIRHSVCWKNRHGSFSWRHRTCEGLVGHFNCLRGCEGCYVPSRFLWITSNVFLPCMLPRKHMDTSTTSFVHFVELATWGIIIVCVGVC